MARVFKPGEYVLHAAYGPCAVVGVQTDALAGECLAISPVAHRSALIRIPMPRVASLDLHTVTAAEAAEAAPSWETQTVQSEWTRKLRSKGGNRGRESRLSGMRMAASAA